MDNLTEQDKEILALMWMLLEKLQTHKPQERSELARIYAMAFSQLQITEGFFQVWITRLRHTAAEPGKVVEAAVELSAGLSADS